MYHMQRERDAQGNTHYVLYWIDGSGNEPKRVREDIKNA